MDFRFTITYYGHTRRSRSATGAITQAKIMRRTYGSGNLLPVICCASRSDLNLCMDMQFVTKTDFPVKITAEKS